LLLQASPHLPIFVAESIAEWILSRLLIMLEEQHGMIVHRGLLSKMVEEQIRRLMAATEATGDAGSGRQLAVLPAEQGVHAAAQQAAQGLVFRHVV
jgi:hypothetical protein